MSQVTRKKVSGWQFAFITGWFNISTGWNSESTVTTSKPGTGINDEWVKRQKRKNSDVHELSARTRMGEVA